MSKSKQRSVRTVGEVFDFVADSYDDRDWVKSEFVRSASLKLWQPLASGDIALELGVGTGAFLDGLIAHPTVHVGVDVSSSMLRFLAETHPSVERVRADATRLPFPSGTFDFVGGRKFLRFCRVDEVFSESLRVLRTGGRSYFVETCARDEREREVINQMIALTEPHQRSFHTVSELTDTMAQTGFSGGEHLVFAESRDITRDYCRRHYRMTERQVDTYWKFLEDLDPELRAHKRLEVVDRDTVRTSIAWIVLTGFKP